MIEPDLLAFAEDPQAFVATGPDEERVEADRFVITLSPGSHFWSTHVGRVRFEEDRVSDGLDEVRSVIRARRRDAAAWTVGSSATPGDLTKRLVELGLESESAEGSTVLVLTEEPRLRSADFEVRSVSSLEDHLASIEVAVEGFGFPDVDAADERRRAEETFEAERTGGHTARLLALEDGRPVATGRAWFSPFGVYLGGGATIPSHRRRGAMGSLVGAAWDGAVRRGTPALATFGNAMSAPPLLRMGFRDVGTVRHLIDRSI